MFEHTRFVPRLLGIGMVGGICLWWAWSADRPVDPTHDVMQLKLHYAQSLLEGIATENYGLIATNAARLGQLSQAAGWEIRNTPEYQMFTKEFRSHVERIGQAGRNRNVDAATVAYFQVTVSCVNCHRYLRESRTAGIPAAEPQPAAGPNRLAQFSPTPFPP